jgi:glycerophosphoryl diester phosphodiesterase
MSRWIFSKVVAHRGGGTLAPENTLAAISHGMSLGYSAIEIDVMLTKDKVPILMHDEHTGRTIQLPNQEKKLISDLDFKEVSDLDAGSWLNPTFAHARVPLFRDVLTYCHEHDVWINIEIKPCPGFEVEIGEVVAQETKNFFDQFPDLEEKRMPLFSSFAFESLQAAHRVAPHIKRGLLIDKLKDVPNWMDQCRQVEAFSIHVNYKDVTSSFIEQAKSMGLGVFCYTVNKPEVATSLLEQGVDSFCTDKLDDFVSLRNIHDM